MFWIVAKILPAILKYWIERSRSLWKQEIKWTNRKKNYLIRSDEGLTLEKSALVISYGGQSTLLTQLIKPNYLVIPLPMQHQFL